MGSTTARTYDVHHVLETCHSISAVYACNHVMVMDEKRMLVDAHQISYMDEFYVQSLVMETQTDLRQSCFGENSQSLHLVSRLIGGACMH